MRPSKAHFVTSCQQLLALGAVLAVLTPAASVISLDVVGTPGASPRGSSVAEPDRGSELPGAHGSRAVARDHGPASVAEPAPATQPEAEVPTGSVDPTVTEVPLTGAEDERQPPGRAARSEVRERPAAEDARPSTVTASRTTVVSKPQPVKGYGAVGVTWSSDEQVDHDEIRLEVRSSTGGVWSGWTDLEYHDEHAPDLGSTEGRLGRPGTDPLLVGEVDLVQVRAVADSALPSDMSLAVVAPGKPAAVVEQSPDPALGDPEAGAGAGAAHAPADEAIELQAATSSAPQPEIFSRKQWGANERLRDGRPSYGSISAGFVHHTVNANDYTRAQVPGIIRSIYAYHTQSRGWSDIGYNFLVDRFGRIWEGRFGGIARPVVGAHTLGYNDDSFAMSAIGNFDVVRPRTAMLRAYGALFAWKLGLHGVDPLDKSQNVSGSTFRAINGHRDAGSTACPGRYLYAKLATIRAYAAEAGDGPALEEVVAEQVDSDLAGTPYPDLVVRRASDGRGMILPTGGLSWFRRPSLLARGWGSRATLAVPDLTGDGRVDVVTFNRRGFLEIRPGLETGGFGKVSRKVRRFRNHTIVASVGDVNGDRRPDFVARSRGRLVAFLGNRRGSFRRVTQATGLRGYRQLVGAGDVTGDGRPDLWGQNRRGRLFLHRGLGRGRFADRARVAGDWSGYDWLVGGVDYTGDSVPDLIARRRGGALMLLPSRGDGTLGRAVGPVRSPGLSMVSGAGQLAGDDAPDLLAVRSDGALVVASNRGTFDLGRPLDTGQSFRRGNLLLNAGDFTGDGHGDVIMRRRNGSLWLFRGDGTGRLAAPVRIAGRRPFRHVAGLKVVADVTGDRRHDVVGVRDGETWVWPGSGAEPLARGYAVELVDGTKGTVSRRSDYDWLLEVSDLQRRGPADVVARDRDGYLYRLDGKRGRYRAPRYLGEATAYNLGG